MMRFIFRYFPLIPLLFIPADAIADTFNCSCPCPTTAPTLSPTIFPTFRPTLVPVVLDTQVTSPTAVNIPDSNSVITGSILAAAGLLVLAAVVGVIKAKGSSLNIKDAVNLARV